MGTSGAYGGSGSQSWGDAHDAVGSLPATGPPTTTQVAATVAQIAKAIQKQFPTSKAPQDYSPSGLLGPRSAGSGTVSSGHSRSSGGGLSSRNSARGAATVWAGHAYLSGDQAELDALGVGLRLDDMKDMSETERCRYILDAVLGAPGSLDEEILRRASLDALKDLMRQSGTTIDESVAAFMSAYVYQTTLVELTSHKASMKLTVSQVLSHEKTLKQYIKSNVKFSGAADGARLTGSAFLKKVGEFRDKALGFLRKVAS